MIPQNVPRIRIHILYLKLQYISLSKNLPNYYAKCLKELTYSKFKSKLKSKKLSLLLDKNREKTTVFFVIVTRFLFNIRWIKPQLS